MVSEFGSRDLRSPSEDPSKEAFLPCKDLLLDLKDQAWCLKAQVGMDLSRMRLRISCLFACMSRWEGDRDSASLTLSFLRQGWEEERRSHEASKEKVERLAEAVRKHEETIENLVEQERRARAALATIKESSEGSWQGSSPSRSSRGEGADGKEDLRVELERTTASMKKYREENESLRWILFTRERGSDALEDRLRRTYEKKAERSKADLERLEHESQRWKEESLSLRSECEDIRRKCELLKLEMKRRDSIRALESKETSRLNEEVLSLRKQALESRRKLRALSSGGSRMNRHTQTESLRSDIDPEGGTKTSVSEELVRLLESQLLRFARVIREQQEQVEVLQSIVRRQCSERRSDASSGASPRARPSIRVPRDGKEGVEMDSASSVDPSSPG